MKRSATINLRNDLRASINVAIILPPRHQILIQIVAPLSPRSPRYMFWDGTGVCLFAKRLEDGKFRWPAVRDGVIRLTAAQLSALLEGLDWRRVHEARETAAPAAAS